ncbi:hypothetical protein [Bacillus sp. JCM 19034]|uniref:hypothetical protein n=1 Tax=Bacillus sp. JCM 19034 TaxID=1481928 RepID=UPI000785BDE6|nr:hypothetical protein [Bacillus sp. JCM 19034]
MKKLLKVSIGIPMITILTACGTQGELDPVEEQQGEQASVPSFEVEDENEEIEEEAPEYEDVITEPMKEQSEQSDIKEIMVHVEGESELREAQFHRSDYHYGVYILDGFTFTSEEPQRDVIVSTYDEEYFTRIITHSGEVSPSDIKQNLLDNTDAKLDEVQNQIEGADFVLREEYLDENGKMTVIYHAVKSYEDDRVLQFTVFLPVREPIEGIAPSMWSMLNTIEW